MRFATSRYRTGSGSDRIIEGKLTGTDPVATARGSVTLRKMRSMKKRTVITTEKREVWVIREAIPKPFEGQTIDIADAIEVPLPDGSSQEFEPTDEEEER